MNSTILTRIVHMLKLVSVMEESAPSPAPSQPVGRIVPLPIVFLVLAVLIGGIVLVRVYVVQTARILESSMMPTLHTGDRVLTVTNVVTHGRFKRGQVVVLEDPLGGTEDLIKRVVALPGDTFQTYDGLVYVNDEPLDEPYAMEPVAFDKGPITVPEGRVMVIGDNRNHSDDSLIWGPVPLKLVRGRAVWLLWPPSRSGAL